MYLEWTMHIGGSVHITLRNASVALLVTNHNVSISFDVLCMVQYTFPSLLFNSHANPVLTHTHTHKRSYGNHLLLFHFLNVQFNNANHFMQSTLLYQ